MNRILTIIVVTLLCPFMGRAADHRQQWKQATDHYLQKQYDSAAFYFEQIAAGRPQNAELYYNLGNSYYRLNRIGMAVLNYERALRIDPSYKEAQDNLAITQARITHQLPQTEDIFFIRWWKSTTSHTHATLWAVASLITFALIFVVLWLRRFSAVGQRIPRQLAGILAFVFVVYLVFAVVAARNSQDAAAAVVMDDDAPMLNADLKGKPLALLPEGATVKVRSERGQWLEISLPDGRTGWIDKAQVVRI